MRGLQVISLLTCVCIAGLTGCADSEMPPANDDGTPAVGQGMGDIPSTLGPEGDSNVRWADFQYPLNAALGDIWGVEEDHFSIDFTITNGKFLISPTEVNGVLHSLLVPVEATAIVYAELYSPGESFLFDTYSFTPQNQPVATGLSYFDVASVALDINNSGDIEPDEVRQVIAGTIEFTGELPNIELRFSLTLEGGQLAQGHYTGLFDFADRLQRVSLLE